MSHLIVVDVENEWQTPGSDYYLDDLSELVQRINTLIDYCRDRGIKIIFVRHVEKDSEDVFGEQSERSALIADLHRNNEDVVLTKYKISPFYGTNLESLIENSDHVVVAGILTNLCVRSLINDLYDRDFNTTLIEDCCISTDEETHQFTLQDIKNTRPEIEIIKLADFTH